MINTIEKKDNTSTHFSLIYAERPSTSDTLTSLNGPTVHQTIDEALDHVFGYVKGRIVDCCPEEFVEWGEEDLSEFTLSSEEIEATNDDISSFLDAITGNQILQVVNWYFWHMGDELCEAFYKIDEHVIVGGDKGVNSIAENMESMKDDHGTLLNAQAYKDLKNSELGKVLIEQSESDKLSAKTIYDAVTLSSSLTIEVDGEQYTLEPYYSDISDDTALAMLQDSQARIEDSLLEAFLINNETSKPLQENKSHQVSSVSSPIPFVLKDNESEGESATVSGTLLFGGGGIGVQVDGYSDCVSGDDVGIIAQLECSNGSVNIRAFTDINYEGPTNINCFDRARNAARSP